MPVRRDVDRAALSALLAPGRSVASRAELLALGVPSSTISRRCGPDGPWQRVLPGVVAGHRGTLTTHERRLAAVKYAGEGAALTGLDALDEWGLPLKEGRGDARVHVLVPHQEQRTSSGFALVSRTRRPPTTTVQRGLPRVDVARAVIDATRRSEDLDRVRTLMVRAVQQRRCTVEDLVAEVRCAPRQRTALARAVLVELRAGIRSEAEAVVRKTFEEHGVPAPRWNAPVHDAHGELVGIADGLWEEEGLVLEIDSMAYHLEPAAYQRTQARQRRMVAAGRTVLAVSPAAAVKDPVGFCREVRAALDAARSRAAAG